MVNSSLGLEILLYLNVHYFIAFVIVELGVLIFKIMNFPYPVGTMISELLIVVFLCLTEAARIFMGHKGNLTEKTFLVIISIGFTVPCVLGVLYLLLWQTYVLRLEIILCGIELILQGLELCFAILCIFKFCRTGY